MQIFFSPHTCCIKFCWSRFWSWGMMNEGDTGLLNSLMGWPVVCCWGKQECYWLGNRHSADQDKSCCSKLTILDSSIQFPTLADFLRGDACKLKSMSFSGKKNHPKAGKGHIPTLARSKFSDVTWNLPLIWTTLGFDLSSIESRKPIQDGQPLLSSPLQT